MVLRTGAAITLTREEGLESRKASAARTSKSSYLALLIDIDDTVTTCRKWEGEWKGEKLTLLRRAINGNRTASA
jgi:hypothetical protein